MHYQGDYAPGSVIYFKFYQWNSSGSQPVPATITSPAISVYKDDNTTESTSGVTLTAAFDTRTGLYQVKIDTSTDSSFYAAGHDFDVVITGGTVGGSVVSTIVGSFSLNNRSPLRPTTAGNTLDVAATGEAGLDFSNIKDATSGHTLTNITIPTVTTVTNDETGVTTLLSRIGSSITINGGRVDANLKYIDDAALATHAAGMAPADVRDWFGSGVSALPANFFSLDIDSLGGVNVRKLYGSATQALNLSTLVQNYAAGNLLASIQDVSTKTGYKLASDGLDSVAPTAGFFSTLIANIWAYAIRTLTGTTTSVTVTGPLVATDVIEIVQGDAYYNADGRALEWMSTSWPDLTGATVVFSAKNNLTTALDIANHAMSVVTPTGTAKVRLEFAASDTINLAIGVKSYGWDVQATLTNGHVVTLIRGQMTVNEDYSTP